MAADRRGSLAQVEEGGGVFFKEDYIFGPESKTKAGRRRIPMSEQLKARLWERRKKSKSIWVHPARRGEGSPIDRGGVPQRSTKGERRHSESLLHGASHLGTYTLAASQNLPAVMKAMGHASVNSTLPYQHQGIGSIRAVIEARNEGRSSEGRRKEVAS